MKDYSANKAAAGAHGLNAYVQRASRRLLATEGPYIAPLPRYSRPQVGTFSWRWERAMYRLLRRHEGAMQRLFDVLPGLVAWALILAPVLLARHLPLIPIALAVLFQLYWLGRGLDALVHGCIGYARIRAHAQIDWRARYEAERAAGKHVLPWERVRHLVIIPNYREPAAKLRATLEALAQQREVAGRIWVVLGMEVTEPGAAEKAAALQREFAGRLGGIAYTVHPAGLPGEVAGKGSNEAWAARWARRHLVDELGYKMRHLTITSCDADSVFHPSYFACLTSKFATDPERYLRFWQAPLLYHNNIWQVPTFIQFIVMPAGIWYLADLVTQRGEPFPLSTYSTSLTLLDSVGYWDPDAISEDWHIFFKCFFMRRGKVSVSTIYLPLTADAPLSTSLWRTAVNRYEQAKRHAWGVRDFSYAIRMYFRHAEIPSHVKLPQLWMLVRHHLVWSASWFVLSFGITVPSLLNPAAVSTGLGHILSTFFARVGLIMMVLSPGPIVVDLLLRPRRPRNRRWWQDAWACLQWGLMPVYMLFLGALPALDAQTRLMMGERLAYRVTEKL